MWLNPRTKRLLKAERVVDAGLSIVGFCSVCQLQALVFSVVLAVPACCWNACLNQTDQHVGLRPRLLAQPTCVMFSFVVFMLEGSADFIMTRFPEFQGAAAIMPAIMPRVNASDEARVLAYCYLRWHFLRNGTSQRNVRHKLMARRERENVLAENFMWI